MAFCGFLKQEAIWTYPCSTNPHEMTLEDHEVECDSNQSFGKRRLTFWEPIKTSINYHFY
jgi:hypothetical protein